jgi:sialate O-acetylesterase
LLSQKKPFLHTIFGDHMVLQQGANIPIWGWSEPGRKIVVKIIPLAETAVTDDNGKWSINLRHLLPGGPYTMEVFDDGGNFRKLRDVYIGEVWLCSGQSNMNHRVARGDFYWCGVKNELAEIASADHPLIRYYAARLQLSDEPCQCPANKENEHVDLRSPPNSGEWTICSPATVGDFSAIAYFFARELQKYVNVPIGLIKSCYGATTAQAWTSHKALSSNPNLRHFYTEYLNNCHDHHTGDDIIKFQCDLKKWEEQTFFNRTKKMALPRHLRRKPKPPINPSLDQHSPTVMYNGMIAPLAPYAIRGVIWCHGESNQRTANLYFEMLKTLIADWRSAWGTDLLFLVTQMHNVNKPNQLPIERELIPRIREAQQKILDIENTGLSVAIDLGQSEFHLHNKQALGERLSIVARKLAYHESVEHSGPFYERMVIEDSTVRIYFTHADGLHSVGPLKAFIIADKDGGFHWAKAVIDGNTVIVSHPKVFYPIAVRYAWSENPSASLYNRQGLPASPFRTDCPS